MTVDDYIDGYGRTDIHAEMIGDRVRTQAYRRAILGNAERIAGRTVLDVGCGTGILSLFAAEAGAEHVYAVEASGMADVARRVVQENGLGDRVTVIKGTMESVELPAQVDVLLSEWMGYFLLYERMLDSVLIARDRWLRPGGLILPSRATLYIAAAEDFELEAKRFSWWESVYGFDLSAVAEHCRTEPLVDFVDAEALVTDAAPLLELDIAAMTTAEQDFGRNFELVALRTETVHALAGWFDVDFPTDTSVTSLTTAPSAPTTHWKQTLFYLPRPLKVRKGERLRGRIEVRQDAVRKRSLRIRIELTGSCGSREAAYYL